MRFIFISIELLILAFFPALSLAEQQFLYNPLTNHWIQDPTNRMKIEILKTLNKEKEAGG